MIKETTSSKGHVDRKSFILGMITAFAECVDGECKKLALSPPFYPEEYNMLINDTRRIIAEHGLCLWFEDNLDIPEDIRVNWFVIFKFNEVLEEYKSLRKNYNPAYNFEKFRGLVSYGLVWGSNAKKVRLKMRRKELGMVTVSRLLFKPGEWPIPK